jgi:IS30 family transposase
LIVGRGSRTAIGTLVERATGWTMLVHLPDGYKADQLREPLTRQLLQLPVQLRRSLTWDQGPEMCDWKQVAATTGVDIYFCDPYSRSR